MCRIKKRKKQQNEPKKKKSRIVKAKDKIKSWRSAKSNKYAAIVAPTEIYASVRGMRKK